MYYQIHEFENSIKNKINIIPCILSQIFPKLFDQYSIFYLQGDSYSVVNSTEKISCLFRYILNFFEFQKVVDQKWFALGHPCFVYTTEYESPCIFCNLKCSKVALNHSTRNNVSVDKFMEERMAGTSSSRMFEKPLQRLGINEWHSKTNQVCDSALLQCSIAFDLRQACRNFRDETQLNTNYNKTNTKVCLANR